MGKNSFFQFKQFTIHQDKCAMKVCTDACTFGAWVDVANAKHILDIGAGTGLLSLMMAQRNAAAVIKAVEVDEEAYRQAVENVADSSFAGQVSLYHTAIQHFDIDEKFDCIVSNPPFFQSDLRSPDQKVNLAHHAETLTFSDLLLAVDRLMTDDGFLNILLPVDEALVFCQLANKMGMFLRRETTLFHKKGHPPIRKLMTFRREQVSDSQIVFSYIYIYGEDGKTYDPAFRNLLKDYYLIFS